LVGWLFTLLVVKRRKKAPICSNDSHHVTTLAHAQSSITRHFEGGKCKCDLAFSCDVIRVLNEVNIILQRKSIS